MNVTILKSKLHQGTVTGVDLRYEGSIVIDPELMEEVGLHVYEKVLVANINTGQRFETYVIEGTRGARDIKLNGATARLGQKGDRIIIFSFATIPEAAVASHKPRMVLLDEDNEVVTRSFAK